MTDNCKHRNIDRSHWYLSTTPVHTKQFNSLRFCRAFCSVAIHSACALCPLQNCEGRGWRGIVTSIGLNKARQAASTTGFSQPEIDSHIMQVGESLCGNVAGVKLTRVAEVLGGFLWVVVRKQSIVWNSEAHTIKQCARTQRTSWCQFFVRVASATLGIVGRSLMSFRMVGEAAKQPVCAPLGVVSASAFAHYLSASG